MSDSRLPKPSEWAPVVDLSLARGDTEHRTPVAPHQSGLLDPAVAEGLVGPTWALASPGTGGNIQSLALVPGPNPAMWVGSDNGGMMRGTPGPKTWAFGGAHLGLESHDIGDICVVTLATGTLTYAVSGAGFGPGGIKDRRNVCFRSEGASAWSPVTMDLFTHVWPKDLVPPPALGWEPTNEEELWYTNDMHFRSPSLVCAIPLPGNDGRHLLVLGGNNGSRQFEGGLIRLGTSPDVSLKYVQAGTTKKVLPHQNPPTFYACIAQWSNGQLKRGSWVGATYPASRTVWHAPNTPTLKAEQGNRLVAYDRKSGIGGIWADPVIHEDWTGAEAQLYFTIRLGDEPFEPPDIKTKDPEHYELVRLRVRIPKGKGLELELPSDREDPRPLEFDLLDVIEASTGLGQVAGIREDGRLRLIYTAPAAPSSSCIRAREEDAGSPGVFATPPVVESISGELVSTYGPAGQTSPGVETYSGRPAGTFFHVRSTPDGWVYVAACKDGSGDIQLGAWRRDPSTGAWSRMTWLTGGAPGPGSEASLDLVHSAVKSGPVEVAIGVVVEKLFEGTYTDAKRLGANVRYKNAEGTTSSNHTVWLDLPDEGEIVDGVRWLVRELNPAEASGLGASFGVEVLLSQRAAVGVASLHVACRSVPATGCPRQSPPSWTSRLGPWQKPEKPPAWLTVERDLAQGVTCAVHLHGTSKVPPNMDRKKAWTWIFSKSSDSYDSIAVSAEPMSGSQAMSHRIALGRGATQVYYSTDNGDSFAPLGTVPAESVTVGADEEGSTTEAPTWASAGLESMWVQGYYRAKLMKKGLGHPWYRLFSFTNDGGLFFSDDGGVTWVWAQPNIPMTRRVPYPPGFEAPPPQPFAGTAVADVTAMAARPGRGQMPELLLATCKVETSRPDFGRVVVSRDGGWTWNGRALCGLPEGVIWVLAEADGCVYAAVAGAGVFVLTHGSEKWQSTGSFRLPLGGPYVEQGAVAKGKAPAWTAPTGFTEFKEGGTLVRRAALNPQRLVVVRDTWGKPRWLVAGLVIDGMSPNWHHATYRPDESVPPAGLWRLPLTAEGLPERDAQWDQIAGLNVPGAFPNIWRALSDVTWDGGAGVVVSTEAARPGVGWIEGAVLWCEDVGAAKPVFRLVMTHPNARAVAMHAKRLYAALGTYVRIGEYSTTTAVAAWQPADESTPLAPKSWGKGYSASQTYFKASPYEGVLLSSLSASIGVFEVTGAQGQPFWTVAPGLKPQEHYEGIGAEMTANGMRVDQGMELLKQQGGWLGDGLKLKDLTASLAHRSLSRPLSLQVLGDRLFVGLMGSGGWSREL
ncbi:MAG: hypothetical protein AMXMBFR64_61810 [Myxococcales bacterium]